MKRFIIMLTVIVSIGLLNVLSLAQDDGMSTFEFADSDASITFPEDWEQTVNEDSVLELVSDGINLMVYDSASIASLLEGDDAESPEDLLTSVIDTLLVSDDVELDADNIKVVELDGREVARLAFETEGLVGAVIALPMDDESLGGVVFTIGSDNVDELSPIVDEVVTSFNTDGSTATGEACTLSITQSNTVQIRVGPGNNRTVIAFLPANIGFDALGQTTDDDGNTWFRVSKEEAAPTKSANETWVAGDGVEQSGNCAGVVDALAPPLIPIRQAQPTAVPQAVTETTGTEATTTDATTDTTTTETSDAFAVDASGAFIVTQGTWLESRGVGNIRCGNFSTGFSPAQGNITSVLSGGGSAGITFNSDFYTYIGNNTYETYYVEQTQYGTLTLRETFTLTSANTGEGSVGGVIDCYTFYLPITVNYIGG
jgi:hypothetical protein